MGSQRRRAGRGGKPLRSRLRTIAPAGWLIIRRSALPNRHAFSVIAYSRVGVGVDGGVDVDGAFGAGVSTAAAGRSTALSRLVAAAAARRRAASGSTATTTKAPSPSRLPPPSEPDPRIPSLV